MFANDFGITDLSDVNIVGASVDTVRQLFFGIPSALMIKKLESFAEKKRGLSVSHVMTKLTMTVGIFHEWVKWGGYRYKIQNNNIGVIILFGSWYGKIDSEGSHLKIKLSPHFISQRTTAQIWDYLQNPFLSVP